MVNNCIYCKCELSPGSVFDVCRVCGHGVWGENMYNAILVNMNQAKEAGDLYQGSVSSSAKEKKKLVPFESQQNQIQEQNPIIQEVKPAIHQKPQPDPTFHNEEAIPQHEIITPVKNTFGPEEEAKLLPPEDPLLINDSGDILF